MQLLDIHVPYQSPNKQQYLCWVSIVLAMYFYFYSCKPITFDDICSIFNGKCEDIAVDLSQALDYYDLNTNQLGNNLFCDKTVNNVIYSLDLGYPVILRLEKKGKMDEETHFIIICGYDNSKTDVMWYLKDPSGADVGGKDVPDTLVKKNLKTKYESVYTIVGVHEVFKRFCHPSIVPDDIKSIQSTT